MKLPPCAVTLAAAAGLIVRLPVPAASVKLPEAPSPSHTIDRDVEQDYALNEALNALKALTLRKPAAPANDPKKG